MAADSVVDRHVFRIENCTIIPEEILVIFRDFQFSSANSRMCVLGL